MTAPHWNMPANEPVAIFARQLPAPTFLEMQTRRLRGHLAQIADDVAALQADLLRTAEPTPIEQINFARRATSIATQAHRAYSMVDAALKQS